jgi:predicted ferric reductase
MWGGLLRIILYVLLVTLPVLLTTFPGEKAGSVAVNIGRNLALMGFMILALQFLLAARVKWIEKAFGLDILIRYHKHMALAAAGLLIFHPALIALGTGNWNLLIGMDAPWYIWAGRVSLVLVIAMVLTSIYFGTIGLTFEKWRLGHNLLAPMVLVLIFLHSWVTGYDLERLFMQVLWSGMFLLGAVVFVLHRFVRPARLRRRPYRVDEVRQETGNVWTVKLLPPHGRAVADYLPGQFHFLTFFRDPALPVEEHHWTISSSPARKDFISSTIKELGDFTSTIGKTKPGDTVSVHGPFGRFSCVLHPEERDLVFVAGGIGITPLMAMLRHMRDSADTRSVVLLYANRNQDQIVFREELDRMAEGDRPRLTVAHILSGPGEGWTGETGHVDRERIEKYCGRILDGKVFYLCCPPQMARDLITALRGMGVPRKRIRQEIFSLLD